MNLLRKCDKYKIRLYAGAKRKCDGYRYFYVHKDNNESIYSAFCEDLEQLAEYLGKEPEETEKLIFSKGGKNSELGE